MTTGSKEFIDMRAEFEKSVYDMPVYIGAKIERSELNGKGDSWYNNDTLNKLFIAYMWGYQCGRINYMNS